MSITFIAVNYNNSECSINLIKSLLPQMQSIEKIIIIDNASRINQIQKLKSYIDTLGSITANKLHLHLNNTNIGYFKALNLGLSKLKNTTDKVVIGNNDLIFKSNFCAKLQNTTFDDDVYVVCPNVVTVDGFHQNPHIIEKISTLRRLMFDIYYSNYHIGRTILYLKRLVSPKKGSFIPGVFDIHMGIGACYILTKSFFQILRRLDDRVFLYGEEAFLSHQVLMNGGRIQYNSNFTVQHLESVTTSKLPPKKKYALTQKSYRMYRNYL